MYPFLRSFGGHTGVSALPDQTSNVTREDEWGLGKGGLRPFYWRASYHPRLTR